MQQKVLVLTIEGLQLAYVGCYGNPWIETPTFDLLAAEGTVFDQHYADRPDAAGARRAWRTGQYNLASPMPKLAKGGFDMVERLAEEKISTVLVRPPGLKKMREWTTGWSHLETATEDDEATDLECTLDAICTVLDQLADEPRWLVWAELPALLPPWNPPEEYLERYLEQAGSEEEDADEKEEPVAREPLEPLTKPKAGPLADDETYLRLQRTYAAAVTYLDGGLGLLWEELERRGLDRDALLIISTDRGYPLGEHGIVGEPRPWLHEELIHLPLILRLPAAAEAGRRIAGLTQSVDLMPTILDAFGLPLPAVHGQTLLPLARGETEVGRPFACTSLEKGEERECALRTPECSFLLPMSEDLGRARQLYVKPDDRFEVNNLIQQKTELAEEMEKTLRDFLSAGG